MQRSSVDIMQCIIALWSRIEVSARKRTLRVGSGAVGIGGVTVSPIFPGRC